jgi:transglutaminase/protease-like cytokinesis protein 3
VCDDYSALFLVMTRAIGLDCYYTHGYTTNTKGETKDHVWDTITVGGVDYIFDPQVEDKQSANGIKYTFFCKTYGSSIAKIYSGYDLAADKAAYNAFRRSN